MTELSVRLDLGELRAYSEAIKELAIDVVQRFSPEGFDETLSPPYLERLVADEGMVVPRGLAVIQRFFATTRSRGFYLSYFSLLHYAGHLYDIRAVKSLLGYPGG